MGHGIFLLLFLFVFSFCVNDPQSENEFHAPLVVGSRVNELCTVLWHNAEPHFCNVFKAWLKSLE